MPREGLLAVNAGQRAGVWGVVGEGGPPYEITSQCVTYDVSDQGRPNHTAGGGGQGPLGIQGRVALATGGEPSSFPEGQKNSSDNAADCPPADWLPGGRVGEQPARAFRPGRLSPLSLFSLFFSPRPPALSSSLLFLSIQILDSLAHHPLLISSTSLCRFRRPFSPSINFRLVTAQSRLCVWHPPSSLLRYGL